MEAAMERWNTLSPEDIITVTFLWRIYNFSTCSRKKYSQVFYTDDYRWRVLLYPKGNHVQHMSAYLEVACRSNLPIGWSRLARFKLIVVNQLDNRRSITKETVHVFDINDSDWGFTTLIPLTVLNDHTEGYLVNDTCIIEARVAVPKAFTTLANETGSSASVQILDAKPPVIAEPSLAGSPVVRREPFLSSISSGKLLVNAEPTSDNSSDVNDEFLSSPSGEIVKFRGFGEVDRAFVPLLEEVCSKHPSLVECLQQQAEEYTTWAFNTLGRTLYFLKTRKPRDMTEESCRELIKLWTTLQIFTFDVSWLKEHVEKALRMKNHMEKARKMREGLNSLDTQRKRLKTELAAVESNFEEARREVAEAEQLLETELGYGSNEPLS